MKKVLSIFLLTVFLFNISGAYLLLCFLLKEARLEAKIKTTAFNSSNTILIKVSGKEKNKNIERVGDDELRYGSELFDIASVQQNADTTLFYCVQDNDEEQLLSRLDNFIEKDIQPENTAGKSKSSQKSISDFIFTYSTLLSTHYTSLKVDGKFPLGYIVLNKPVIDIAVPPPRA